jgi:hypothetical protein
MPNKSLSIEQILTVLAETPTRLETITTGLAPAQLRTAPNHDERSANDVLAHFRACADVWGGCIVAIIIEERPTLRAINPRTWINQTDYRELEFRPSLRAFATQRTDLLRVLGSLPHEDWDRAATVTGGERSSRGRCCSTQIGWLAMNGPTSSRSSASSP